MNRIESLFAFEIAIPFITEMKPAPTTRYSRLIAFISKHQLPVYVFIAFLWSWAWWIPATLAFKGALSLSVSWLPLLMIGAPGPSISAIALTCALGGMEGLKKLLRKFLIWRVNFAWYLVALITPSALLVCAMAIYILCGGALGRIDWANWPMLFSAIALALPYGPISEELGWRG
jgi:hypothetical protein